MSDNKLTVEFSINGTYEVDENDLLPSYGIDPGDPARAQKLAAMDADDYIGEMAEMVEDTTSIDVVVSMGGTVAGRHRKDL